MSRLGEKINSNINFENVYTWVDFGTGNGSVVQELKWNSTAIEKISIDKYPQYFAKDWIFVDELKSILNKHRDLFTGIDVIEHLTKEDGIKLLNDIDLLFKYKLFFTPRGYLIQDETTHPELIHENPWQKHLCGWDENDFNRFGYKTIILTDFHYPKGYNRHFDAILSYKID